MKELELHERTPYSDLRYLTTLRDMGVWHLTCGCEAF